MKCLILGAASLALLLVASCGARAAPPELKKQYIWDIKVVGARVFSEDDARDAIVSQESSRIPVFGSKQEFDAVAFQADLKRLEHFYQRHGYYQFAVDRTEVNPCKGDDRVCIKISISEGEPTKISRIALRIMGHPEPPVSDDELAGVFGMKVGDIFDHDKYLAGKKAILDHLKKRGYPLPKIEGKAVYDKTANSMSVELETTPGTAATIGYIMFEGLEQIRAEDAMNRLPIKTGQPYNPQAFDDSEALLADLDIFRSINVELKPRKGRPDVVDVTYHVREKPLKSLQFGGGLRIENSRQEAKLRGEWINRNFHNHMRTLGVRAEPRYAVLPSIFNPQQHGVLGTAEVSMRHPSFLNPRQNLRTAIGIDSDLEQGYQWYGPRVSGLLDRRVTRKVTVAGGYAFRYLTFYNVDTLQAAPVGTTTLPTALLFNENYRLGYITQSVAWDKRDRVIEPHGGFYADLDLAESVPQLGSAFKYFRMEPELRGYMPITRRSTLAARVLYGQVLPWGGSASPITERFYGGGSNSHRGFSYHRLSPMALTTDNRTVPVGGDVTFMFSLEERVNMFMLGNQWIIGAVFMDAGDVTSTPALLDLGKLHYAVGSGIRYSTPVGVIRADVGVRLNRLDALTNDRANPDPGKRFAVHLSFGEAF